MTLLLSLIGAAALAYLTFSVLYHIILAVSYFVTSEEAVPTERIPRKYLLLVPAHNEEELIGRLVDSALSVDYGRDSFQVAVIADNCTDRTAEAASQQGVLVLERHDETKKGKGFALAWALGRMNLDDYGAVVVVDADNKIDQGFFHGLDEVLDRGASAVQCYNSIGNPDDSAFTRILSMAREVDNCLYHHAKYKLGLSSFLMGNGMCFTTDLLKKQGWTTGTMAEDLEYYSMLVGQGVTIGFAARSKVYHQESRSCRAAADQRLRWSSGKFHIARTYGLRILLQGLRSKDFRMIDASFPLILPNLSLMVNLTGLFLVAAFLIHPFHPVSSVIALLLSLLVLELLYLLSGKFLMKVPLLDVIRALGYAPLFLLWKGCIDLKAVMGRQVRSWGRSNR